MNYKYRVYNALTGMEYGDVDSYRTARLLTGALQMVDEGLAGSITIDILVAETVA